MAQGISFFVYSAIVIATVPQIHAEAKCPGPLTTIIDNFYDVITREENSNADIWDSFAKNKQSISVMRAFIPVDPKYYDVNKAIDKVQRSQEKLAKIVRTSELEFLQLSNDLNGQFKLVALSSGIYFFNMVAETWDAAERSCKKFGLKFALLENERDKQEIAIAAPTEGNFWVAGKKNSKNCKMLYCSKDLHDVYSFFTPCSRTYNFICQVPPKCD